MVENPLAMDLALNYVITDLSIMAFIMQTLQRKQEVWRAVKSRFKKKHFDQMPVASHNHCITSYCGDGICYCQIYFRLIIDYAPIY